MGEGLIKGFVAASSPTDGLVHISPVRDCWDPPYKMQGRAEFPSGKGLNKGLTAAWSPTDGTVGTRRTKFRGELNYPVGKGLIKGLTAAWSPNAPKTEPRKHGPPRSPRSTEGRGGYITLRIPIVYLYSIVHPPSDPETSGIQRSVSGGTRRLQAYRDLASRLADGTSEVTPL